MTRLWLAAAIALSATSSAIADIGTEARIARWQSFIEEATRRFNIPQQWIRDVMRAESAGRTTWNGAPTTSKAGAMGLMQIMPATWAELRERHALGIDPHDPRDNILAGAAYLREMYQRFGAPLFLAAYHAGPQRVEAYLAHGTPLPRTTRAYVESITSSNAGDEALEQRVPLFAIARTEVDTANVQARTHTRSLFVVLKRVDLRREGNATALKNLPEASDR